MFEGRRSQRLHRTLEPMLALPVKGVDTYQGRGLIADPIHQYILYTRPDDVLSESTEQDLIDSPWMQRLRRVPQLQSARWVFPAAEHSRFQHSLGAMHMAGRFARQLHASLRAEFADAPSAALFEELLGSARTDADRRVG